MLIRNLIAIALPLLLLGGCMKLPENNGRSESRAIPTTEAEQTSLGQHLADKLTAHPGKNGVPMLRSGRDAFVARSLDLPGTTRLPKCSTARWHQDHRTRS